MANLQSPIESEGNNQQTGNKFRGRSVYEFQGILKLIRETESEATPIRRAGWGTWGTEEALKKFLYFLD